MLERVTQQIFAAGLALQTERGDDATPKGIQPAINHLDSALNDIRATVFSWSPRPEDRTSGQSTDEIGTAVTHLSAAAVILRQLVSSNNDRSDGDRWMATNNADHATHRALLDLLDELCVRVDATRYPIAHEPESEMDT